MGGTSDLPRLGDVIFDRPLSTGTAAAGRLMDTGETDGSHYLIERVVWTGGLFCIAPSAVRVITPSAKGLADKDSVIQSGDSPVSPSGQAMTATSARLAFRSKTTLLGLCTLGPIADDTFSQDDQRLSSKPWRASQARRWTIIWLRMISAARPP